ncbi:MAG: tetratricopeptide repeat protein, partial [Acidobacteriota bacterium]
AHRADLAREQAEIQRQEAEKQAELAGTVNAFLVEIFGEGDPSKHLGDEPTARDLLRNGRERLDTLESQPRVLAALAVVMGQVYQELGDQSEARELYARALDIRRRQLPAPHPDQVESLYLLADAENELGQHDRSEALLVEAFEQLDRLPDDPVTRGILLNDLGATRHGMENLDSASELLAEALHIRRQSLGDRHEDTAQTLNNLAVVRVRQGATQEAADLMRRALAITEENLGPEHPDSMLGRSNLAATLHRLGDSQSAAEEYTVLIETQRRVFGKDHQATGQSLNNLGHILLRSGQLGHALTKFTEAEAELGSSLGANHPKTLRALSGIALTQIEIGDPAEALSAFEDLFRRAKQASEPPLRLLQGTHARRGRLWLSLGDRPRAIEDFCACLRFREEANLPSENEGEAEIRELLKKARGATPGARLSTACSARLQAREAG